MTRVSKCTPAGKIQVSHMQFKEILKFGDKANALRMSNLTKDAIQCAQTIHKIRYMNVTSEQRAALCRKRRVVFATIFATF